MFAHIVKTLGRTGMVVEGDAGADDVVMKAAPLWLIAWRLAAPVAPLSLKNCAPRSRQRSAIATRSIALSVLVTPFLTCRGRRWRRTGLCEPVHAVVLDDVGHVDAAADRMRELPEADRGAVAVAETPR